MKARDGIYKAQMVSTTMFLPSRGLRHFSGSPFFLFGLPFEKAGEVFMSLLQFLFELTYTLILPSTSSWAWWPSRVGPHIGSSRLAGSDVLTELPRFFMSTLFAISFDSQGSLRHFHFTQLGDSL
jgi:hypothetical protein